MPLNIHSERPETTNQRQRINELDLVRGFALCGIFFINIIAMGYLLEAYLNPYAFTVSDVAPQSETTWLDGKALNNFFFIFTHVFIDQKMMGLFALLFGASAMLFLSNLKVKNLSTFCYFKHNLWLLLFGLLHATFLYSGDILFIYSLCALFLFPFSKLRPSLQVIIGLVIYCLPIYLQFKLQISINDSSAEQTQELTELWKPSLNSIKESIEFQRNSSYIEWIFPPHLWDEYSDVYSMYSNSLMIEAFARSFGLMLIGMAFITLGVLPNHTKHKPVTFYRKLFAFGLIIGLTAIILGLWLNYYHEWDARYSVIGGGY